MSIFGFGDGIESLFSDIIDEDIILNADSINHQPAIIPDSVFNEVSTIKSQTTTLNTVIESLQNELKDLNQSSEEDKRLISSLIKSKQQQLENINQLKLIASRKDEKISRLINISTNLEIDSKTKMKAVDTTYQRKRYTSYWEDADDWASIASVFDMNTGDVKHSLSIRNQLTIAEVEKDGELFVHVTNDNPFTTTTQGSNYFKIQTLPSVPDKGNRFSFGLNAGYSTIFFNDKISHGPTIGIGLQYALIRF